MQRTDASITLANVGRWYSIEPMSVIGLLRFGRLIASPVRKVAPNIRQRVDAMHFRLQYDRKGASCLAHTPNQPWTGPLI
jgi:hypothetical protein